MSNARELAQIPSTPSGRRNLIINGDFRVSQRGDYTSATNFVHNTYMLDRWKVATGVTSTIQDLGGYIKLLATASATSTMRIFQLIEDLYFLEGKTVVLSCEMKTNSSNGRLQINNGSWVSTNAVHSGSGQWEKLYFTTTMPSSLSVTSVQVGIDGASSADVLISSGDYCEIKNVQLEVGSVATEFEHRSYGEELALCQRYCFVEPQTDTYHMTLTGGYAGSTLFIGTKHLPVPLRAGPSISTTGNYQTNFDAGNSDVGTISVVNASGSNVTSVEVRATCSGAPSGEVGHLRNKNDATATFILDAEL